MTERDLTDPITVTCLAAGSFTLSAGTMEPAIVLERLLVALAVLDLAAYRRLLAPEGPFASAPPAALRDGASSWWGSAEADVFLQTVIGAINRAAPAGYACFFAEHDRIELARIHALDSLPFDVGASAARVSAARVSVPPSVSAIRARVG